MSLFEELKRRNVFRVAVLYIVSAWLILQVTEVAVTLLELPIWSGKLVFMLVALGFFPALMFSWMYELTPDGLKRDRDLDRAQSIAQTTGRKVDALIVIFGALAVVTILVDRILPEKSAAPLATSASNAATATPKRDTASARDSSIAVLPFVNMSSEDAQEFFSDGISEELLNVLAQLPGLRVAARTSSFQFKGQNRDIGEIAETLGVAHVLEGSVRKSGDKLRITAQLIKADDGFHMWSDTYDRELTDIFAIQEDIARAVAGELQVQLGLAGDNQRAVSPQIIEAANPRAYEAYLQGRQLINRRGKDNLEKAVAELERSLRLDSNFAPAHAQLVIAIALLMRSPETYGDLSLAQVVERAAPHLERALELAPDLAEAHGANALLEASRSRHTIAIEHARKALAINPSYVDARNWMNSALEASGRFTESVPSQEELYRLDPQSVVVRMNMVEVFAETGREREARDLALALTKSHPWAGHLASAHMQVQFTGELSTGIRDGLAAFALEPDDQQGNAILATAFGWLGIYPEATRIRDTVVYEANFASGRYEEAVSTARPMVARDPENRELVLQLAAALGRFGNHAEARQIYERVLQQQAPLPVLRDQYFTAPIAMARLAHLRAAGGDMAGAREAAASAEANLAEVHGAGVVDNDVAVAEAMLAATRGDAKAAAEALEQAVARGWRDRGVVDEPMFASMKDGPDFASLRKQLDTILANEREKTLLMICRDNPAPDAWAPLSETCEGL